MKRIRALVLSIAALLGAAFTVSCANGPTNNSAPRRDVLLDSAWRTTLDEHNPDRYAGFEKQGFNDSAWVAVDVPHNWDQYQGFRQTKNGQQHGYAWYRRTFSVDNSERGRRVFLMFEGVGSFATVWVNGQQVGHHAGGLTTFTLDITDAVHIGGENLLAVRADEPLGIHNLPWVSGGDERASGFSEGSQPLGIFRPVHLITTGTVRVEPFGVQSWCDAPIISNAIAHVRTELKNYDSAARNVTVVTRLINREGSEVARMSSDCALTPSQSTIVAQDFPSIAQPRLWSLEDPYLYTFKTTVLVNGTALDQTETPFGFRWIKWPDVGDTAHGQFFLNGKPVFINGTAEYEHLLGTSAAFSEEQVRACVKQIEAAGFNAFRDAHQPHNLRFDDSWQKDGMLWWTQFSAHIWFDNDEFRANFKSLLRDWVKERRNNPALVLWGLQNESLLPTDFAKECSVIIREMDPTASSQRKITTCNGGTGTDWDVLQNWSGTYSGNPANYATDLRRELLVGEYGAWRSLGLHTEGPFVQSGPLSEDRMTALMESKIRLAESVRNEVAGHFSWVFMSHANPGRDIGENGEQVRDGYRELDQIGPANNKGFLTIWGEPLDVFYLYRSNYVPKDTQPMVYIVSHTWPDRWTEPGKRGGLIVYSNCDEVELFNGYGQHSLGKRTRDGIGTHFQWDDVDINYNILYAEGRVGGKVVARDIIQLHHLPSPPETSPTEYHPDAAADPTSPIPNRNYLYRVNCGGPAYLDSHGNHWLADRDFSPGDSWGSISWASAYPELPPNFGSLRQIFDPIAGTNDSKLFQTFRYGRNQLHYVFSVPDGDYDVELFLTEPWYGTGGGMDCTGWRLFDVALNGQTMLRNVDIWKESGRAHAMKKVVHAHVSGGRLEISFPRVAAGEAVISAIAISTTDTSLHTPAMPLPLVNNLQVTDSPHASSFAAHTHLDTGDSLYGDATNTFAILPEELRQADWISTSNASRSFSGQDLLHFGVTADADVYVTRDTRSTVMPAWLADWDETPLQLSSAGANDGNFTLYRHFYPAGSQVTLGNAGDAAMYNVIVKPRRPPPPPQAIEALSNTTWQAAGNLRAGYPQYTNGGPTFATVPAALTHSDWIKTARNSGATSQASFKVNDNVIVYVALDSRLPETPSWLADWTDANQRLTNSDRAGNQFFLLKKRFTPGSQVTLGENGRLSDGSAASMYSVIVQPVRASIFYSLDDAIPGPNIVKQSVPGQTGADATGVLLANAGDYVEWTVKIGVADRYGLNFLYASGATAPIRAQLTIYGPDGQVLRTDPLVFQPTATPLEWNAMRTRTGASLNAGTYKFRITNPAATPLYLRSLEME